MSAPDLGIQAKHDGEWGSLLPGKDKSKNEREGNHVWVKHGGLMHVHTYVEGGTRRWSGIARSGDWANSFFIRRDIDSFNREAQDLFDEKGRRLMHVEVLDSGA